MKFPLKAFFKGNFYFNKAKYSFYYFICLINIHSYKNKLKKSPLICIYEYIYKILIIFFNFYPVSNIKHSALLFFYAYLKKHIDIL